MLQIEKRKKSGLKTDLAPLIDVVFLLLIFFMLTFTLSGKGIDLNLPNGISKDNNNSLIVIAIDSKGTLRLKGEIVEFKDLTTTLQSALKNKKDKAVAIQADNKTLYDLFVRVFDKARLAGAKNFSLIM